MPHLGWLLAGLAIFMIGVTKSGFGSGVGLMIVPMMALALGTIPGHSSDQALGLLLPLLILGDLVAVWQYRRLFSLTIVKKLLPGTIVGVVIGSLLLAWINSQQKDLAEALVKLDIGLESVALVGLHWWRVSRGQTEMYVPKPSHSNAVGGVAAISSTLAHAAGPIIALYLLPQRLERQLFVGTCAIYFFLLNSAKLPAYWHSGEFAKASPAFSLRFGPLVLAGAIFGFWLNKRMNDRIFTQVIYFVTFGLGWYILFLGGQGLYAHALK